MSGQYGRGYLGGGGGMIIGTDQGKCYIAVFKGRSIVKVVSGGHQARDRCLYYCFR